MLDTQTTGTKGRKLHITGLGMGFWDFTSAHKPVHFESIERFNHVDIVATGTEKGTTSLPVVRVYDAETGEFKFQITAYENTFRGGVRVATGDVNHDGLPDLIVTPGSGRAQLMKVYNGAPNAAGNISAGLLTSFNVFPTTFLGGSFPSVGDINRDGANEIVVSADAGWLPLVGVYNGRTLLSTRAMIVPPSPVLGSYLLAMENTFRGGVRVAVGDLNNDGYSEVVAARGAGGPPTVKVFNGNGLGLLRSFNAFSSSFLGGVYVSIGDFNGDGIRDIITGAGPGWLPQVAVFSGTTTTELARFLAYDGGFRGGVRVAAKPLNGGNPGFVEKMSIWLAPAQGNTRPVRQAIYKGPGLLPELVDKVFENGYYAGGILIG
jgi:hypothetical protein